ncbi:type IV secretion system protein [Xanthomonas euvesicatoria]|uniref:type IV secretion system protein n=1 Tax=Xanthomonas euvesicatoria TaxID=456327 RepID=UPI000F8D29E4|nr:type IV secretion system protein [Xanthomonas euvesicatoria]
MQINKSFLLVGSLMLGGYAYAGVPVTVVADVPSTINQIETIAKWKAQYDQMVSQINQMQKQYDAVTVSTPRKLDPAITRGLRAH